MVSQWNQVRFSRNSQTLIGLGALSASTSVPYRHAAFVGPRRITSGSLGDVLHPENRDDPVASSRRRHQ